MTSRIDQIKAIAKNNAMECVDQGNSASGKMDYLENMQSTIADMFPDWTADEAYLAEGTFYNIVK